MAMMNARIHALEAVLISLHPEKKEELSSLFMNYMDAAISKLRDEIVGVEK